MGQGNMITRRELRVARLAPHGQTAIAFIARSLAMIVMGTVAMTDIVVAQGMPAQIHPVQVSVPPGAGRDSLPAPGPFAAPPSPGVPSPGAPGAAALDEGSTPTGEGSYSYNPSGRRDPFGAIGLDKPGVPMEKCHLRPLQCTSLTELSLIGIIWGGFGYTAMVQAPDGKGYTIRQGTKIGPNDGVVSAITENALVVQERYTDVYGKKQVREYVKLLHPKENNE
jgi:type IV pilus assembly protein PilP